MYVVTSVTRWPTWGGGQGDGNEIGDVRIWHLADMGNLPDVRFAPERTFRQSQV